MLKRIFAYLQRRLEGIILYALYAQTPMQVYFRIDLKPGIKYQCHL